MADDISERHALDRLGEEALQRLTATCRGRGPISECPILGALGPEEVVDAEV